jgi:hypothetical protein
MLEKNVAFERDVAFSHVLIFLAKHSLENM